MSPMTREFALQGARSPLMLACHLFAVGLALAFVVVLSRYERRLVSRSLGVGLLCLRLSVLAVILLTLLQPTVSWTLENSRVNRILIGIDLSESMATIDRHAGRGEKLRIARGLELIGNQNHKQRLERWQKAFDSDKPPEWVDPDENQDGTQRETLEDARRDYLQSIFEIVEKLPRREIARRLLTSTKAPLLDQLKQTGRVELFAFAGQAESVEVDQLSKIIADPPASLLTDSSDLSLGLNWGTGHAGEIAGIILLTDGRDHGGRDLAAMATSLQAAHRPVYPILIGSRYRQKDLAIVLLEHPQTVYKGDHPQLKVTLSTVGFDGKAIDVELIANDKPDAEPIRKSVIGNGNPEIVLFDLDADELGRHSFDVRTPVQEGETRDDNNSRSFSLNVIDDRAKVFMIEGEARWEFRYLDAALSRDERIALKTVLFEQPFLGVLPEPFFPQQLNLPADVADPASSLFSESDLVIVGDVSPEQFPDVAWQALLKYVSEGGTLILSPGGRDMPLAHRSAALEQLLPISTPFSVNLGDKTQETPPPHRGLPITLTADGEQQSMLQFAGDLEQNIRIWRNLPGQTWALLGDAKPNATVWATTQIPAGQIEGLPADRKYGIIVHQFVGAGQVVWLGIDATWRWRYRVGDKYHHRFWGQLARWAAANKLSSGTDFVRFGPDLAEIHVGQETRIRARWTQAFLKKFPNLQSRAEFVRRGDHGGLPLTTIDLIPTRDQPLQHEGRALSLPAGEYQVRLVADHAALGEKPIETTLKVSEIPSPELSDLSTNRDLLEQIANSSGGRLFLPDQVRDLPKMFKKEIETTTQYEERSLWDRWPWMLILFTLLTCEWIVRKINGLP